MLPFSDGDGARKERHEGLLDRQIPKREFPLESIRINSTFGSRVDPFTGKHKQHKGLDLRARYEEVLSMFDGYVKGVGYDSGSGNISPCSMAITR